MSIILLRNLIFAITKSKYDFKDELQELKIENPVIYHGMLNFFQEIAKKKVIYNKKVFG